MESDRLSAAPATMGERLGDLALPGIAITDSRHEPNTRLAWHRHDFAGFLFALEGAYQEGFAREEYWSRGRSILYKPAQTRHANRIGPTSFRSFIVEIIDAEALQTSALPDRPRFFSEGALSLVGARIYEEFTAPDAASPLIIDGLVRQLIGLAARVSARPERTRPGWLMRAKQLMDEEPAAVRSIGDLAREAGVHPDHFSKTFHSCFGVLAGDYLRERRLERARRLLRDSDLSICQIALACDFSDQSHLTRLFRRRFGVTPQQYRTRPLV